MLKRIFFLLLIIFQTQSIAIGEPEKNTKEILKMRKQAQLKTINLFNVFYDFTFDDKIKSSNITFTHKIVDDAGKFYIGVHYDHGNGIAVADVDSDGLLDVYFLSQLGPNELWKNLGKGKFKNITKAAGVSLKDRVSVSASFADVDNDGDNDLFVTTVKMGNVLFENNGNGTFKDITLSSGLRHIGHSSSATFFDYNNDGLLDLFLTNVGKYTGTRKGRGGYFIGLNNAFQGHLIPARSEKSLLYRNLGSNKFMNVTSEAKLDSFSWSGDATFVDFNNDSYPDLYVLNMQGDDHYYENQKGKYFIDKTAIYFPKTSWGSMGIKFFDYNNDGAMDLYITDMHSDMSEGVHFDKEKSAIRWDLPFLQDGRNNIFGNSFYRNIEKGKFEEVSDRINVENYWPWGVSVDDLNADGYQDIFVSASMNYPFGYGVNNLLINNLGDSFLDSEFILEIEPRKNGKFEKEWFKLDCSGIDKPHPECLNKTGLISVKGPLGTRSSVIFDLDDDGDLDIITNEFNAKPQVLISNLSSKKNIHYLKINLVGSRSNKNALGAKVTLFTDSREYTKYNDGKSGYLSQSQIPLYFGLGEFKVIKKVEVVWPGGKKQVIDKNIPLNKIITINEK